MFNVKVFKVSDLIKYFIEIILVIGVIFIATKVFTKNKEENITQTTNADGFINYDLTGCIDMASGIIKETNKENDESSKSNKSDFYEDILKGQISFMDGLDVPADNEISVSTDDEKVENNTDSNVIQVADNSSSNIELAKTELSTQVVTNNPITLRYDRQYGNVKIKNETSHTLTDEMLNPNIDINNKNILLFHTHTCESYTSSEKYTYNPTGNYRTTDLNFTVARVGDELTNHLKSYGYNVLHDKTLHDYPSYNGSYTHSLATVQNLLKNNPTDIIFDIHRDAIGSRSDYAPCVKIGDDVAAQIMFVIGSDEGGLWHPNWNQNLKFAIKVQAKAEELYPGLFKPITLTKYRYNQHCGKYASIIEVGATRKYYGTMFE